MAVDTRSFRQVMSQFTTGVTVVATVHNNIPHGLTVASFCSLSLEPPLVLVCIDKKAVAHNMIAGSGIFAVSILHSEQAWVSRLFADPATEGHRFDEIPYHTAESGAPILNDCLAWIDCRVQTAYEGGDHTIFIGEVLDLWANDETLTPLVYFRSGYRTLA